MRPSSASLRLQMPETNDESTPLTSGADRDLNSGSTGEGDLFASGRSPSNDSLSPKTPFSLQGVALATRAPWSRSAARPVRPPSGDNRFRRIRGATGGSNYDRWSGANKAHMCAFDNSVEGVRDVIDSKLEPFKVPESASHYGSDNVKAFRVPLHLAALGSAPDVLEMLAPAGLPDFISHSRSFRTPKERLEMRESARIPPDKVVNVLQPMHLVALYGHIRSHPDAVTDPDLLVRKLREGNLMEALISSMVVLDSNATTPLHLAAMAGNKAMVEVLVSAKVPLNLLQAESGLTALHLACQNEHIEIAQLLVKAGANAALTDSYGNSALHWAARSCDSRELVECLIEAVPAEIRDDYVCFKNNGGVAATRLAVEGSRIRVAEFLIEEFWQKHLADHQHEHETLLLHLAAQKGSPQMVVMLCEHGFSTEERDNRAQTPLHFAAEENKTELIVKLCELGADREARDENGYTPLLAAVSRDSVNAVNVLLNSRCLASVLSYYGENLLVVAVKHNATQSLRNLLTSNTKVLTFEKSTEMLKQPDIELNTALHHAARSGNMEILKTILPFYKDVNGRNAELQTALHVAVRHNHENVVRALLGKSACSINLIDKRHRTPLFLAMKKGSADLVQLLLDNGANPLARLKDNKKIPLDVAVEKGNGPVVRLLLEALRKEELGDDSLSQDRIVFPLHEAVQTRQLAILRLVLKKNYVPIDAMDENHKTCLELAIDQNFVEGVEELLNHRDWAALMRRRYKKRRCEDESTCVVQQSPMQMLVINMPELAQKVMDKCIVDTGLAVHYNYEFLDDKYVMPPPLPVKGRCDDYSCTLKYPTPSPDDLCPYTVDVGDSYGALKPNAILRADRYNDTLLDYPVQQMLKFERFDLLQHDLVQSYITMKWNRHARTLYYAVCLFHAVYVGVITYFTVDVKPERSMTEQDVEMLNEENQCLVSTKGLWIMFGLNHLHLILSVGKIYQDRRFLDRLIDVFLILLAFLTTLPGCKFFFMNAFVQWNFLIGLNFYAWIYLLNLVRKLPRFGVYVLMVWQTMKSFMRFSPILVLFLAPFFISFHVLLSEDRGSSSFVRMMVHTFVRLTGELEYVASIEQNSVFMTYLLFLLFLFIGCVCLMNLLVGLAVSDINKTLEKASRTRMRLQIETIHHVECMMPPSLSQKFCRLARKVDVEENHKVKLARRFRNCFRCLGLSKLAIKREISCEKPLKEVVSSPSPEPSHHHSRHSRDDELQEMKRTLTAFEGSVQEIKNSLADILVAMRRGHDVVDRMIDDEEQEEKVPSKFI